MNSSGILTGLATSRAAPVFERFRTAQSIAPPPNSMVAAFSVRRREAARFFSTLLSHWWTEADMPRADAPRLHTAQPVRAGCAGSVHQLRPQGGDSTQLRRKVHPHRPFPVNLPMGIGSDSQNQNLRDRSLNAAVSLPPRSRLPVAISPPRFASHCGAGRLVEGTFKGFPVYRRRNSILAMKVGSAH
jgi:hypothetical protein